MSQPAFATTGADTSIADTADVRRARPRSVRPTATQSAPGGDVPAGQQSDLLNAATALRVALERTGDALARPRLEALLASEEGLVAALAILPTGPVDPGADRGAIRRELDGARRALQRCRRMGRGFSEVVRLMLQSHGVVGEYGSDGRAQWGAARGALRVRG